MSRMRLIGVLMVLVLGATPVLSGQPVVRVLALFPGKAMLSVDGQRRLLSRGELSPEGIELLDADADQAVVRIDGERLTLRPGGVVSSRFEKARDREMRISRDQMGGYQASGMINGRAVNLLVDTGASSVALSQQEAERLGIRYLREGRRINVRTASGMAEGYRVNLDRVRLGEIELRNVEGTVVVGAGPSQALLGMSFLGRLEMENRGNLLVLRHRL